MIINGKQFDDWIESDIEAILQQDTYRENDHIDYKETFAILDCIDKAAKKKKQDEFRHDICSFANGEGGFLILGIKEENGIPDRITGISINDSNIDRFELDRRNELSSILPLVPMVMFKFIRLKSEKYVVVVQIKKGHYGPYLCLENEGIYKFFIRRGNRKQPMSYTEIKNSFIQSGRFADAIKEFRKKKVEEYKEIMGDSSYALLQVIPETFTDTETYINLYDLLLERKVSFTSAFQGLCFGHAVPNVDGVCYPNYDYDKGVFFQAYDSGIVEVYLKLTPIVRNDEEWINSYSIVQKITCLLHGIHYMYNQLERNVRGYFATSIIGCKGMWSDYDFGSDYKGIVDRNEILTMPIEIKDISNKDMIVNAVTQSEIILANALSKHRSRK